MLDGPDENPIQMIDTTARQPSGRGFQSLTQQGAAMRGNAGGLSEEQMRLMEENRRKAIERKRRSMQTQLEEQQ